MSYKVYNRFDLARMIVSYLDGVRYVSIDGASTIFSTGTLVIKPGNNITFSTFSNGFSIIGDTAGTANSTNYMMASERDNYFKTSANTFANSTHTHGSLALTNLSGTSNSNGLSLSAPNIGIAGNIISAGSQSANASGTVVFFNSNGVSFGMSGNSMITASIDNLNSQAVVSLNGSSGTLSLSATDNISIQNTSNTIVIGGPASVIKALSIGGTDSSNVIYNEGVYIEAGNNVTLSKSDNSITIGADFSTTLQNVVYPAVSDTTFQTGTVLVQGLNNITVTYNSNTINIVGPDVPQQQTGISGIAGSAASTVTDGTVVFANANGISFGLYSNTMTASHDAITSQSVQTQNVHNLIIDGNTTGTTSEISSGTLYLVAGSNITLSQDNNTITIIGQSGGTVTGTAAADGINALVVNSGASTSATTLTLSNSNNVSFGINNGIITASASFSSTQLNQVVSAPNGTYSFETLKLVNSNGVSWLTGTGGIIASVNTGYITLNSSSVFMNTSERGNYFYTSVSSNLYFADSNGVTFGSSTSGNSTTITASVSLGTGGGAGVGSFVILGNTTNNTTASGSTIALSAANNITIGASNNSIIRFIGPEASLYFVNSNNISFGTSTSGISTTVTLSVLGGATANFELSGNTSGNSTVNGSLIRLIAGNGVTLSGTNTSQLRIDAATDYVKTASSSLFQHTSNTSAITSNAVNTSQSSLFQLTSATSAITSNALNTNQSSLFQLTSATSNITTNAAYSTHTHGIPTLYLTNLSGTTNSASNGLSISLSAQTVGGGGGAVIAAGTQTGNTSGTVIFSNSNSFTFGMSNNSIITASFSESTHAHPYIETSQSSLFQLTSATSAITSRALNTSQSSLFQHTSATSIITTNALHTSQSSLFQHTSATSAITTNAAHSTHTHGSPTLYLTNLSGTVNSASNGLSISLSAQTAGTGGGGGGVVIAAGTQTGNTSGTVVFSNSNSITFGMTDNSIVTASFSQSTHAHPYIETSQSSLFQHTSATSVITSNAINTSQSSLFQHTSATSVITSIALNTSQSSLFQHTSATSAITTNAAYSTHTHGNVSLYLTNLSGTTNSASNGLSISLSAATGAGGGDGLVVIAAGTQTGNTTGTVVFSNSNSFTFGMSNNSVVTASFSQSTHDHPYVNTSQSSLFQQTSATSAITSNALNTNQSSLFQHTSATSAITLSALNTSQSSLFQLTSATSNITSNAINTSQSSLFQHTSATSAITTGAVGRILLSGNYAGDSTLSGNTIRIYGGNNVTVSGTNTTAFYIHGRAGSIYFNDSNGVTFGASVSSESTTITASHDAVRLFVLSGNTSGQSTASGNSIRLVGGNNITVSAGTGTNSSIIQINGDAGAGADGYNSVQFTNSTANSTMPIVWAGNSNGSGNITLGLTGSTVTGSAPSGGVGSYNILAAGTQTANTTGTVVFSNSNGLSFGMSNNSVITASHEERSLYFSNANGVTFGTSTNGSSTTVSASVNAGGAANTVTIYAGQDSTTFTDNFRLLNDATLTASQYVIFYTTISTATNGNTFGIAAKVPNAIALSSSTRFAGTGTSATNASITLNSNGLAISVADPSGGGGYTLTGYDPFNFGMGALNTATSVTSFSTNRTVVNAVQIPFPVVFNKLQLLESFNVSVSNATAVTTLANTLNLTNNFTLFKRSGNPGNAASTLFSSVTSGSAAITLSYNFVGGTQYYGIAYYKDSTGGVNVYSTSNTTTISNGSSIFTGIKLVEIPIPDVTLTAGEYFLALKQSTSGNSFSVSNVVVNLQGNTLRLLSSTAQLHFGGGYDFCGNGYATTISHGEIISKVSADARKIYYRLGYGNVY